MRLLLPLILGGCAAQTATTAPPAAPAAEPAPAAAPAPAADPHAGHMAAPATSKTAVATLESRSGSSVTGTVRFAEQADGSVKVSIAVAGATPGEHGMHVHEKGDCSAPDGASAGGHYNPSGHAHGAPDGAEKHPGDFGNITVGADGTGTKELTVTTFRLADGAVTVADRSVIFHEKPDDYGQPTGNAGGRQACGVIKVQ